MKRSTLSQEDIGRIELKFECIRRNENYIKDYKSQRKCKRNRGDYERLNTLFYSKWFHFPLLDPSIPIKHYKTKNNYPYWVEENLGGLITSDYLCPQTIKVESPELRKQLLWRRKGYKTFVSLKKSKVIKIPFPIDNRAYSQLDDEKIKRELRNLKLTVDLEGFTKKEIKQQLESLLKELNPLAKRFLHKGRPTTLRPTSIVDYLKTFDKKKCLSHKEMSDDENQQRKFKGHLKNARILIDKGGWHYI